MKLTKLEGIEMKNAIVRLFSFAAFVLTSLFVAGAETSHAGSASDYVVEGVIPTFSFEGPVKLQVKVFDSARREVPNARVIYEILPAAAPPPFGHDMEMAHMATLAHHQPGRPISPEAHKYMDYLHGIKTAFDKAIHKPAMYDPATGYYTVSHVFMKFPWQIRVYVAGPDGRLQLTERTFPLRVHCEYFDVTNIELVKTYLHQSATAATKQDWPTAKRKLGEIGASLRGKHGMYYMRKHHGWDTAKFEQHMLQLEKSVEQASTQAIAEKVRGALDVLDQYESDFAAIEVKPAPAGSQPNRYEIKVWDQVNQKGVSRALVVIQEQYYADDEVTNPAIVPFQPPDQGMYHAKAEYVPRGTLASEVGNGLYAFETKEFATSNAPKRVFVYYHLDLPGVPSKFITKEIKAIGPK